MGNILGDYIHRKRQELGLSLRKFGKLCRLSHTYIDSIEKGIDFRTGKPVGLTNDTLLKLAEGLHVHVDILFLLSLENISDHFSFYYDSAQRQQIERVCWPIIRDRTQPIENRFSAAIDLFRSFYSASIEFVAFDINHVDFKTYVAMLLNQSSWINLFGINLYQKLVDQYGIKGGIQDGEIHFIPIVQEETEHQKKKEDPIEEKDQQSKDTMPNSLTLFGYQGNNMLVKELNDEEAVLLEEILNMVRNHMRK